MDTESIHTQEEIRLDIAEFLKDCNEATFMKVVRVCFLSHNPAFTKELDERGFHKIEITNYK